MARWRAAPAHAQAYSLGFDGSRGGGAAVGVADRYGLARPSAVRHTGMRLMEGLRLRVKDVDFDRGVIVVRQAKGDKDRVVMLPRSLADDLRKQVLAVRAL